MNTPLCRLLAGWILWSLGFLLMYGLQATGCAAGWDRPLVGPMSLLRLLLLLTVLCILSLITLSWLVSERNEDTPSLRGIIRMVNGAAVLAVLAFAGVFWTTLC